MTVPAPDEIVDLSELPAPEPFEELLRRGASLAPGQVLWALLPRDPIHAKPHLHARGLSFEVFPREDGRALLRLWR
ncbi:MAG: DUF2249 domain-containing protein [Sandaracinaceae bacterium]|nr:DUF2249 domain-containing protein [Sandaracinaceae bacterium]